MMRDHATATNALGGVDQAGQSTVAYHNVAGAVARRNQSRWPRPQFSEAAMLTRKIKAFN